MTLRWSIAFHLVLCFAVVSQLSAQKNPVEVVTWEDSTATMYACGVGQLSLENKRAASELKLLGQLRVCIYTGKQSKAKLVFMNRWRRSSY